MPSSEVSVPGGETRRLHPASLIFAVAAAGRGLLLPGLIVLFASRGGGYGFELFLMVMFIPTVAIALARYVSYRYRFAEDELIVREGIVTRNERHIPYARIQNVDLVQNPLHRMLGVAEVRLQTAAGDKPEATMKVLSLDAVERVRTRVFAGRAAQAADETAAAAQPRLLHSLSPRDLITFGLISNRGMVVVAAAIGILWQFDLWEENWPVVDGNALLAELPNFVPAGSIQFYVLVGVATLIAAAILLRALSIGYAFLTLYDFRLTRDGDDLRSSFGLLTRISKTIPRHRIQVLTTHSTPLHRLFGRVAVQVQTAGSREEAQGGFTDKLWLAPLIRAERVSDLAGEALPGVDLDTVVWQPVPRRAWKRLFRVVLLLGLPLAAGGVAVYGPPGALAGLLIVPPAWVHARQWVRRAGWALTANAVFFSSGWLVRRTSVAHLARIQAISRGESPFDRRHGMASIQLDTAGASSFGHSLGLGYLEAAVVDDLSRRLARDAGRTAFRW